MLKNLSGRNGKFVLAENKHKNAILELRVLR